MFTSNPFAELSTTISPAVMQAYVIIMVILVVGGTIIDMVHKKSAKFFFEKAEQDKAARERELSGGDKMGIAIKTVAEDVLTSAEFCNPKRRMSHLLTMYGFVIFVISTIGLVFAYTGRAAPPSVSLFWHLGAAMICVGGYWFWFGIRVDVAAEGNPWYRVVRADMFILSLLGTATFGLLWSLTQAGGGALNTLFLALFIISSTVLFGGVLWSKFAHMFFKPAAAYQKRILKADGSNQNMPKLGDLSDPELQEKFRDIPKYMGNKPPYMGLGIKREEPRHY